MYDEASGVINLIDFGAAREYPKPFVGEYLEMVRACADKDRAGVIQRSITLGFLTGAGPVLRRLAQALRVHCAGLYRSPTRI